MRRQAETALQAGRSVIVDAVHQAPEDCTVIAVLAEQVGARFFGLRLDASIRLDRLAAAILSRCDATVGAAQSAALAGDRLPDG